MDLIASDVTSHVLSIPSDHHHNENDHNNNDNDERGGEEDPHLQGIVFLVGRFVTD